MKKSILFILTLLCSASLLGQSIEIPTKSNKYINDYANIIPDNQEDELAAICKKQEQSSTAQIVVVTTNDVPDDYPIAEFSQELFEKWGIGQAGVNNGVLIVVFPNQRQSRVHVGYGLEGALTDGYTKTAQRENLNPHFKVGDYFGGLKALLTEISQRIDPEAVAHRAELARIKEKERAEAISTFWNWTIGILIVGLLTWLIIYSYMKKKRKEEERLREEEEKRQKEIYEKAMRQQAEQRQKEKERKYKQDVKQQIRQLKNLCSEKITKITHMAKENFMNASEILPKLLLYAEDIPAELADDVDFKDATNTKEKCDALLNQINKLTEGLLTNWEFKIFTEVSVEQTDKILQHEKERLQKLFESINQLTALYGQRIWTYPVNLINFNPDKTSLTTTWTKIVNALSYHKNAASKELLNKNYSQAKVHAVDANAAMVNLDDIDLEISSKRKQIDNAENFIKKSMLTLTNELTETTQLINNPIVSSNVEFKNGYIKYINTVSLKDFTSPKLCILDRHNMLVEFMNKLKEKKTAANQYISAHKAKIEAEEEEKRRRKKRAEEAEEEERRRRRREEEESSYRSSSSYYSSSSSYDSGSSSSSDFGGGSSGGGGSDNSW